MSSKLQTVKFKVSHDRMISLCERPDSMCLDEKGNLFIFESATSKVAQFSRVYFEKIRDIALVDRAHCRISAQNGILAVLMLAETPRS